MESHRGLRLVAAEVIAAATFVLCALYFVNYFNPIGISVRGESVIAIVLSIVAFALSFRMRSPAVAGLLILGGILMQIPPAKAIAQAGVVAVPGPILGDLFFAPVLIFGILKAIGLRNVTRGAKGLA